LSEIVDLRVITPAIGVDEFYKHIVELGGPLAFGCVLGFPLAAFDFFIRQLFRDLLKPVLLFFNSVLILLRQIF